MTVNRKLVGISLLIIMTLTLATLAGCGGGSSGGGGSGSQTGWTRVGLADGVLSSPGDNVRVTGIAAGGPGLVAVGYRFPENSTTASLVVWSSSDAHAWSRQDIQPGETHYVQTVNTPSEPSIAAGPGGLVIGWGVNLWTSIDGLTWTEMPSDANFNNQFLSNNSFVTNNINDVSPGGPGFVAAGAGVWGMQYSTGGQETCVWTSPGLTGWTRVPYDASIFGGQSLQMNTIAAAPPGVVAGGYVFAASGQYDRDGLIWTSPDGLTWTQQPWDGTVFGGAGDQEVMGISSGGPGTVAVGYSAVSTGIDSGYTALVWTSADGVNWTRAESSPDALAGGRLTSVIRWGPGLVAGGSATQQDEDSTIRFMTAGVWESMNGTTWSRTLLPRQDEENLDDLTVRDLVVFRGGLVAVGTDEPFGGPTAHGAIWISPELSK